MPRRAAGLLLCLTLAAGCAGVVPPALQKEITPGLSLAQVRQSPAAHKGQTVLWGGRIIRTVNKPKGTLIEVLALPLDAQDRPQNSYDSSGRFIVSMTGFLDPEIYHHGREVTVVGQVVGVEALPVGEVKYTYVLLRGREVKLWGQRPQYQRRFPDPFWGPLPGSVYPYWYYRPYYWW